MPHQDKSQKCYLDLGINLEWPYFSLSQQCPVLVFSTTEMCTKSHFVFVQIFVLCCYEM